MIVAQLNQLNCNVHLHSLTKELKHLFEKKCNYLIVAGDGVLSSANITIPTGEDCGSQPGKRVNMRQLIVHND